MTVRGDVLDEAKELTEGDRSQSHGDPHDNLACAANTLNGLFGTRFDATDVALIYTVLKMVRIKAGDPNHRDHYVDSAAYMAMAWECQDRIDQGFGPGLESLIVSDDPIYPPLTDEQIQKAKERGERHTYQTLADVDQKQEDQGFPVAERKAYLERLAGERLAKETAAAEAAFDERVAENQAQVDKEHETAKFNLGPSPREVRGNDRHVADALHEAGFDELQIENILAADRLGPMAPPTPKEQNERTRLSLMGVPTSQILRAEQERRQGTTNQSPEVQKMAEQGLAERRSAVDQGLAARSGGTLEPRRQTDANFNHPRGLAAAD